MAAPQPVISGRKGFRPEVSLDEIKQPVTCPAKALFCEKSFRRWNAWTCDVPPEHTVDQVMAPGYFAPYADRLKHMDRIEFNPLNQLWWGQARILAVVPHLNRVILRACGEFDDYACELPKGYTWEWGGAAALWRIYKGRILIGDMFVTQAAGVEALNELVRSRPVEGAEL